ncbi:unnamed protein product [Caretta caretta]
MLLLACRWPRTDAAGGGEAAAVTTWKDGRGLIPAEPRVCGVSGERASPAAARGGARQPPPLSPSHGSGSQWSNLPCLKEKSIRLAHSGNLRVPKASVEGMKL